MAEKRKWPRKENERQTLILFYFNHISGALHDLVAFVEFKKRKKHQ